MDFLQQFQETVKTTENKETSEAQKNQKVALNQVIGIVVANLDATIYADISQMLEEDRRKMLDGYVVCLAHVVEHDVAWMQLEKAFGDHGESIPKKYGSFFGRDKNQQPIIEKPRWTAGQ